MERIKKLCSYLSPCKSFADVGCDHGYCTEYMVKSGLCQTAIIADISAKSLNKAEVLLNEYIKQGKVSSVCCDGLEKIPSDCEQVLIAGMGGEEIIKILKNSFIPQSFVFQPMKNSELLREYLLECGCELIIDDIFFADEKFYFIIKGKLVGERQTYTKAQIKYGKQSLTNPILINMLKLELEKKQQYLQREMSAESREGILKEVNYIQGVISGAIK
ncbi:MAG: SAM-dependent methyltransferase [Clostridiales bacterium]|nr:SAM-dependent methyltransferase [Clostridiales bacterium]